MKKWWKKQTGNVKAAYIGGISLVIVALIELLGNAVSGLDFGAIQIKSTELLQKNDALGANVVLYNSSKHEKIITSLSLNLDDVRSAAMAKIAASNTYKIKEDLTVIDQSDSQFTYKTYVTFKSFDKSHRSWVLV